MFEFKKFKTICFVGCYSTNVQYKSNTFRLLESCHDAFCLMRFLARRSEKTFLLGNVVWQRQRAIESLKDPESRLNSAMVPSDSGDFGCVQVPTGHEKDGGGESLSEEEFFFIEPSVWTCFLKCFEVIFLSFICSFGSNSFDPIL